MVCQGKYQNKPALPFTPGISFKCFLRITVKWCWIVNLRLITNVPHTGNEIAGEVLEVGEGVNHLKVGDRVFAMCPDNGGFAQEVVTPAQVQLL